MHALALGAAHEHTQPEGERTSIEGDGKVIISTCEPEPAVPEHAAGAGEEPAARTVVCEHDGVSGRAVHRNLAENATDVRQLAVVAEDHGISRAKSERTPKQQSRWTAHLNAVWCGDALYIDDIGLRVRTNQGS